MGLFRSKTPEEKAAALAEQQIRGRYIRARGDLYDALFDGASSGGLDAGWVEHTMPDLARKTAETWLALYPNPTDADLKDLWEKDLRTFWNRSYWDDFGTSIKDVAQEVSVAVHAEVMRLKDGPRAFQDAVPAVDGATSKALRGAIASLALGDDPDSALPATDGSADLLDPVDLADAETAVGVSRAIEVWRWAHAERLSDDARSRLDRVARLVSDNSVGSVEIAELDVDMKVRFEQTAADIKHAREMIQHVVRWTEAEPEKFQTALGLYLDGGGTEDGFEISP